MKDSKNLQRQQKTSYEDSLVEVRLEAVDKRGVPSDSLASEMEKAGTSHLMESIAESDNLRRAYKRVKSNGGAPGIDGMTVEELGDFLKSNIGRLKEELIKGSYKPSPVRRVEIPKPDGGVRLLGIPTVVDRFIQQAVSQILSEIFEKAFSDKSYGFRPSRSAHDAIEQARVYVDDGYKWAVDMDLEKFFDRVNHDRLMHRLSTKIVDKRLLKLIRSYLQAGVLVNGVKVKSSEGTPQGGPLSPLLSNIVLDELDKELEKRGHRFVRYADDVNIYVKSKRSAQRVLDSVTSYVENKLKLKVNREKSKADRPWKRKFLGFSIFLYKGKARIRVHDKSVERLKEKLRKLTNRNQGISMKERIKRLNRVIVGWVNYFRPAMMKGTLTRLDEWLRRRLRACLWKQWPKIKTRFKALKKLGLNEAKAWEYANTRKGYWRTASSPILHRTMNNQFWRQCGLKPLSSHYSFLTSQT